MDVRVMTETSHFNSIQLAKTGGQHGADAVLKVNSARGKLCGVVFGHRSERIFYARATPSGTSISNEPPPGTGRTGSF
jgi:hypothetical protein